MLASRGAWGAAGSLRGAASSRAPMFLLASLTCQAAVPYLVKRVQIGRLKPMPSTRKSTKVVISRLPPR